MVPGALSVEIWLAHAKVSLNAICLTPGNYELVTEAGLGPYRVA